MAMLKAIESERKPVIMAGPCSAESYDQLFEIAKGISDLPIDLFRAGIWKPRTRPNGFEGPGEDGLKWLVEVRDRFRVPVCTEVALPNHVDLVMKYGLDAVWIGARTTVNPFYVQDIVDALKGVDIPIIVKNPIHADLNLWRGSIERILNAGFTRICALHRGFYHPDHKVYRNIPNWQVPLNLKTIYPSLQLLCDISHICGRKDNLQETAQIALDLQYDGLMVEVHEKPESALSDADQQITSKELKTLLSGLIVRGVTDASPLSRHSLEELRKRIDNIDRDIVSLFNARMRLATEIGYVKRDHDIPIFQPERWAEVMQQVISLADKGLLSRSFIMQVYDAVHQESILHQSEVMQQTNIYKSKI